MTLKEKLPVSYLLFTTRGRINRFAYWVVSIFIWSAFYVLLNVLHYLFSYEATWALYPVLFWALIATATKCLHDTGKSAYWLSLVFIPVFGPLLLIYLLGFRKGNVLPNGFGPVPNSAPDYFINPNAEKIPHLKTDECIVNDITQLNPVVVAKVETPATVEELQTIIKTADKFVSIGTRF